MKKKQAFYIAFFAVLVVGFFIVLSKLIPGFAATKVPPVGYVQPFRFTTQDGNYFSDNDVKGKVFVAEYFFTTCKGICPRLNTNMRKVYDRYKDEKDFYILSHTCNPETDSAPRLKRYADSMKVATDRWIFLTGKKDSLYYQARLSYHIDDPKNNLTSIEDDFLHTQFFALINKKGEVKKIYDGLKQSEVDEMISDIDKLLKE
ncbi:MAG: SCO family protein [Chitinophagaceae bacterium]